MRAYDWDPIRAIIMASGHTGRPTGRPHNRTDQCCSNVRKFLPRRQWYGPRLCGAVESLNVIVWMIAWYAIFFGGLYIGLAFRLKQYKRT